MFSVKKFDTLFQQFADFASEFCGTPLFLSLHLIWWGGWFIIQPEKFPFNFLTMLLSLEAIILAIFILNSSNRQGDKDREIIREDLKLDTTTNKILEEIRDKLNERL